MKQTGNSFSELMHRRDGSIRVLLLRSNTRYEIRKCSRIYTVYARKAIDFPLRAPTPERTLHKSFVFVSMLGRPLSQD